MARRTFVVYVTHEASEIPKRSAVTTHVAPWPRRYNVTSSCKRARHAAIKYPRHTLAGARPHLGFCWCRESSSLPPREPLVSLDVVKQVIERRARHAVHSAEGFFVEPPGRNVEYVLASMLLNQPPAIRVREGQGIQGLKSNQGNERQCDANGDATASGRVPVGLHGCSGNRRID